MAEACVFTLGKQKLRLRVSEPFVIVTWPRKWQSHDSSSFSDPESASEAQHCTASSSLAGSLRFSPGSFEVQMKPYLWVYFGKTNKVQAQVTCWCPNFVQRQPGWCDAAFPQEPRAGRWQSSPGVFGISRWWKSHFLK